MNSVAPLHINFAPRTVKTVLFNTPWWGLVLALVGVALILFSVLSAVVMAKQDQLLNVAMERAQRIQKAKQVQPAKPVVIAEGRALMINAITMQLNVPWSDVFDAIESATPANIALVSIEPDVKKQLIKGQAEALTSEDMIAYIERLKKEALFANVMLVKHEVNQQDPYHPYRFDFVAQWVDTRP